MKTVGSFEKIKNAVVNCLEGRNENKSVVFNGFEAVKQTVSNNGTRFTETWEGKIICATPSQVETLIDHLEYYARCTIKERKQNFLKIEVRFCRNLV